MNRQLPRWLPAFPLAAAVVYTNSVYSQLPPRMPTHWGIDGQPNSWSPRAFGAWLLPALMLFVWVISLVLPKLDPRRANYEKFGIVYDLVITAIVAFEGVVQWAMLNVALGHPVNINTVIYVSLGALFAILGLAMPFTKPTRFFPIHKAAGIFMVVAGVVTIWVALTSPPQVAFVAMLTATLAAAAGSVLVSYIYWRQR